MTEDQRNGATPDGDGAGATAETPAPTEALDSPEAAEATGAADGTGAAGAAGTARSPRPLLGEPVALKNPAELPEVGDARDPADAALAAVAEDLTWLDGSADLTPEERADLRARREAKKQAVQQRRRRRRNLRIVAIIAAVLTILGFVWLRWVFGGLDRMPDLAGQAGLNTPGENYLLVATNPEESGPGTYPRPDWRGDFANSDMVLLLHYTRDRRELYVVSIPGQSRVPIPGRGVGTLSEAFAAGGARLYVKTVESYTGLRLDRVAAMDLNAFRELVDQAKGIVVEDNAPACGERPGPRRLDGQAALEYIALQACMPNNDLDRVARQQAVMKQLMASSLSGGIVTNPFKLTAVLRAGTNSTTLENDFGWLAMLGEVWSARSLRPSNTTFLTVPTSPRPLVTENGSTTIELDAERAGDLFEAIKQDRVADYLRLSGAVAQ